MRLPTLAALLTIAAALILVAPASAATNLAPNPGFEDASCDPAPPCDWTQTSTTASVTRDTTSFHADLASMRLTGTSVATVQSSCITGLSAGDFDASVWHRADGLPDALAFTLIPFTGASCDGTQMPGSGFSTGVSGSWQQSSSTVTAPASTQSALLQIDTGCIFSCSSYDAFIDDVALVSHNVTSNPGFEINCSGVPCDWTGFPPSGQMTRDTTTFHGGQASMRLFGQAALEGSNARSCATGLAAGTYDASFWHRSPSPSADYFQMQVVFFAGATCANGTIAVDSFEVQLSDSWQQAVRPFVALQGTQSASIEFYADCNAAFTCTGGSFDVFIDDVVFVPQQPPTAVAVSSFAARRSSGGVTLNWRTSSEVETLGFHVYRQQRHGKLVKLNRALLPSVFGGTAAGHSYSWLDRNAPTRRGALRYRLQAVRLDGNRSWVGAATVAR